MLTEKELLAYLKVLGFVPDEEDKNTLVSDTVYQIHIELDSDDVFKSKINYGNSIKVWSKVTSNLQKPENLVVLECILRLLRKGYDANRIELEKTWPLGHREKGHLDILLKGKNGNGGVYAMIECKTWGEEYVDERNNLLEDGGQLFSYFIQERSTKLLVLYSSIIEESKVKYRAEAIDTGVLSGNNQTQLFSSWNRSFIERALFDDDAQPYLQSKRNIKRRDLHELDKETGKGVFNSFAEILRRHVVSDKSNAFNKIFNLFVCKIYDEDTRSNDDDEMDFQWKLPDSYTTLIQRLAVLYEKGLETYLGISVTKAVFNPLTEFGFIDIFDDTSYQKNGEILKEVVELLQGYQIKYSSKHQFLGDFFEKLLTTGIKQEAGQFFTPIPLTRFILRCIPIESIIKEKIENKETYILPYILDFACGSGHFLTEAIDEVENHIDKIELTQLTQRARSHLQGSRQAYLWAKEYIYGIDKDYRLAKTSKVAMFLNGDGDATVINGDGLDDFYNSNTYVGRLKAAAPTVAVSNFDIVVSNPPFSISGFKRYLSNADKNFLLYPYVSAKSSEIECFFLERLTHLVQHGGYAGIILPLSILNNETAIYSKARRILLLEFDVCAIIELREKTFMATPTTTVVMILRKRPLQEIEDALDLLKKGLTAKRADSKMTEVFQTAANGQDLGEFKASVLQDISSIGITLDEITLTHLKTSLPDRVAFLMVRILTYRKESVIAFSGEKKDREKFLGYRFSTGRGDEGIHLVLQDGQYKSHLYNPQDDDDSSCVSTHVRKVIAGKSAVIPDELAPHLKYVATDTLFYQSSFAIENPSSFFEPTSYTVESNSPLGDFIDSYPLSKYSLQDLIDSKELTYFTGCLYNKDDEVPKKTKNKILTASNIDLKFGQLIFDKTIHLRATFHIPQELFVKKNDIIISNASGSLKHLGKVAWASQDLDSAIGGFLGVLRFKNVRLAKAIYYRLLSESFRRFVTTLKDQNINNLGLSELMKFEILVPKNLNEFYKQAIAKETEFNDLHTSLAKLRQTKS